jgi:hypothetical protein
LPFAVGAVAPPIEPVGVDADVDHGDRSGVLPAELTELPLPAQ